MKERRLGGVRTATEGTPGELQVLKARFFRALAHPLRIRILEELTHGPKDVQDLQARLDVRQPLLSQQLAVLRGDGVVTTNKQGLRVQYDLRDPLLIDLLGVARRIISNRLTSSRGLLRELERETRRA